MNQIDDTSYPERLPAGPDTISDRWVRVFLAAAEEGSFTAAAARLGLGQPAVSHAVKRLEETLGVRLFDRTRGGIRLTGAGAELQRRVGAGYEVVDAALRDTRASAHTDKAVTLAVSTALATYWLMPRLAGFKDAHPDIELRVITQDTDAGVGREEADLWIPLGSGPWPAMRTWDFADERIVPVASPSYLDRTGRAGTSTVVGADLLHNEERYRPRYDWPRWFEAHGLDPADAQAGQRTNDYSIVVHAALEGQGVALGWLHIVAPLLDQGRLTRVGDDEVQTAHPFSIVVRADAPRRESVDALRRWLLAEAAPFRA